MRLTVPAWVAACSVAGRSLRNDSGPALNADSLQVDQGICLRRGLVATGSRRATARCACSAPTSAAASTATGASCRNDSGPALYADSLQVDQACPAGGFTATGSGGEGAVGLVGSHIGGDLDCTGAAAQRLWPSSDAYSLQVGQGMP